MMGRPDEYLIETAADPPNKGLLLRSGKSVCGFGSKADGGWVSGRKNLSTPMSFLRGPRSFEIRILFRKTVFAPVRGRMT